MNDSAESQRVKETKRLKVKGTKSQRDKESKSQREEESKGGREEETFSRRLVTYRGAAVSDEMRTQK